MFKKMNKFYRIVVILWILCLITLYAVAHQGYKEIEVQREVERLDKRAKSSDR